VTLEVLPEDFVALRKDILEVSQVRLAELLQLSVPSIKKYESGGAIPSYEVLIRMAELAGVKFEINPEKKHPLLLKKEGV